MPGIWSSVLFLICVLTLPTLSAYASPHSGAITSYTALGDSYASGDGAGSSSWIPRGDPLCGRFSDAYPVRIANSSILSIDPKKFRNAACGGASSVSILLTQLSSIQDSKITTLTVGGNEVDFFTILNECVHQWRPLRTCDAQLKASEDKIEDPNLSRNFNNMLYYGVKRLSTGARLLVTGYATVFNEETTQCDPATFSVRDPDNFLSRELRARFNNLVRGLNEKIRNAAEAQGAEYVDIDTALEGHRFCEEGVVEPDTMREETWLFNLKYENKNDNQMLKEMDHNQHIFEEQTLSPNPVGDFFDLTRVFHPTG